MRAFRTCRWDTFPDPAGPFWRGGAVSGRRASRGGVKAHGAQMQGTSTIPPPAFLLMVLLVRVLSRVARPCRDKSRLLWSASAGSCTHSKRCESWW